MSDVAKTPREELECKKKYLYEYGMFWECNDGSKCQILEDDVCDLLNKQQDTINKLRKILAEAEDMIEVRLAEHYLKEYENIKHNIIGENDE